MIDTPLLRLIKRIARTRYSIDLAVTRAILALKREPRFLLKGHCVACGRCCESPSIHMTRLTRYLPSARSITLAWHRLVNGFEFLAEDRSASIFIFTCTHFDPLTRRCDSYNSRPGLCRDYPRNLLFAIHPEFFPECGFRPVDRNADRFKTILESRNLPPDTLDTLKKNLHLE